MVECYLEVLGEELRQRALGASSDNAAVETGQKTGAGRQLEKKFERFYRRDNCEMHASANVAKVIETVFPRKMNVPSVLQLVYLGRYIFKWGGWTRFKKEMLTELYAKPMTEITKDLLQQGRFEGDTLDKKREAARAELTLPPEPNAGRWGTLLKCVMFFDCWWPLVQFVFYKRFESAENPSPGSIPSLCAMFVAWSGSQDIVAVYHLIIEFLLLYWKPFDDKIQQRDEHYNVDSCFRVFSRTRRAVEWHMTLSDALNNLDAAFPEALAPMQNSFEEREVTACMRRLLQTAQHRVVNNSERYFRGVYLWVALGDPVFAPFVWEAISHVCNHRAKPRDRTEQGMFLEEQLRDGNAKETSTHHQSEWQRLTSKRMLNDVYMMVKDLPDPDCRKNVSERARRKYAHQIKTARESDAVRWALKRALPAMSHTQPVEKLHLDLDQVLMGGEGGRKMHNNKSSRPSSNVALVRARVAVKNDVSMAKREFKRNRTRQLKDDRIRSTADIAQFVPRYLERLSETLDDTRVVQLRNQARQTDEADEIAPDHAGADDVFGVDGVEDLECPIGVGADGEQPVMYSGNFKALLERGASISISLSFDCYATGECKRVPGTRGASPTMLKCSECQHPYHWSCLKSSGWLPESTSTAKAAQRLEPQFCCKRCGGNPLEAPRKRKRGKRRKSVESRSNRKAKAVSTQQLRRSKRGRK